MMLRSSWYLACRTKREMAQREEYEAGARGTRRVKNAGRAKVGGAAAIARCTWSRSEAVLSSTFMAKTCASDLRLTSLTCRGGKGRKGRRRTCAHVGCVQQLCSEAQPVHAYSAKVPAVEHAHSVEEVAADAVLLHLLVVGLVWRGRREGGGWRKGREGVSRDVG